MLELRFFLHSKLNPFKNFKNIIIIQYFAQEQQWVMNVLENLEHLTPCFWMALPQLQ